MLWDGDPADRETSYGTEHVLALREMVQRHLPDATFTCLSDWHIAGVNTRFIPQEARKLGERYPKLWLWSREADLGRFLYLDLDCVLLGDLGPLVDRDEPVVLWEDPSSRPRSVRYNTSMMLMDSGARPEVWEGYDGRKAGGLGTDQAWVRTSLGPDVPTWGPADGVVSYKRHCQDGPGDARAVFFHGRPKPWDLEVGHWARAAWKPALQPDSVRSVVR